MSNVPVPAFLTARRAPKKADIAEATFRGDPTGGPNPALIDPSHYQGPHQLKLHRDATLSVKDRELRSLIDPVGAVSRRGLRRLGRPDRRPPSSSAWRCLRLPGS